MFHVESSQLACQFVSHSGAAVAEHGQWQDGIRCQLGHLTEQEEKGVREVCRRQGVWVVAFRLLVFARWDLESSTGD